MAIKSETEQLSAFGMKIVESILEDTFNAQAIKLSLTHQAICFFIPLSLSPSSFLFDVFFFLLKF